jgi:tetraacyldisaccharide-1-P 4'-kinase
LITTAKDYVRFNDINDPKRELREIIDVLDMEIRFEDVESLKKFL